MTMTKKGHEKKGTFSEIFREYMAGKVKLAKYQQLGIIMLLVVFAGLFGWVYEFIFVIKSEIY